MGVVSVPGSSKPDGTQITPPAVMFKVGDGTTTFANLPWGSGLAADVYAWAKKSGITVSTSGSGDFISAISWSNDQLNVTKGSINITATGTGATGVITGISASGKTITYTQESLAGTPSSGSSAGKAITAFTITQDANGKISKITPTWGDISTDNQKITVSDGETTSS